MSESEEKGYEVIDKRKVKLGEDGEVHTEPEEPSDQAQSAQTDAEEMPEEFGLPPMDIYSMLRSFVSLLGMNTWQWLGLMKNPVKGELITDLAQAKISIDMIAFMVQQLDSQLDPAERRELQAMLSDLRMNFVQQSSRQQ